MRFLRQPRHLAAVIVTLAMALAALCLPPRGDAKAHFLLNLNVRILHVEHLDDGLRVFLRLPMPYVVAGRLGPVDGDGLPAPAPYTTNRMEDDTLVHYLDVEALRADPLGLGQLVADGHRFMVAGSPLPASVEDVRVLPIEHQLPFASLEEARTSFQVPLYPWASLMPYVGDSVVDVVLRYRTGGPVYDYSVTSSLDPGLEGQDETANLLLDHLSGNTKVFRARGLLSDPIKVSRSWLAAAATFIKEGVRHILEGWDHLLFVVCLALGAVRLSSLLWRATGFTVGHSVTLIAGFYGFVPSGAWFIPTVETGIALSIIYAALIAVMRHQPAAQSEATMCAITTAIGLLHGLGFSFVLHEILRVDSPNLWQSLLAFNLGVELGQIVIILATWPLFQLVARWNDDAWRIGRWGVALPCVLIAALWTGQRALLVMQSFD